MKKPSAIVGCDFYSVFNATRDLWRPVCEEQERIRKVYCEENEINENVLEKSIELYFDEMLRSNGM